MTENSIPEITQNEYSLLRDISKGFVRVQNEESYLHLLQRGLIERCYSDLFPSDCLPEFTPNPNAFRLTYMGQIAVQKYTAEKYNDTAVEEQLKEQRSKERGYKKRQEFREWGTLIIALLALVLSIISLIWQEPLH